MKNASVTKNQDAFFWELAEPLLFEDAVSKGTMMGFPCLRVHGGFFASAGRNTGDLIVKLPAARVQELIDAGIGEPFAPAGRRFREWIAIPDRDQMRWQALLQKACKFVQAHSKRTASNTQK